MGDDLPRTRGDILLNISVLGAPSLDSPCSPSISPGWMKCHFYGLSDYPMYISVTEMILLNSVSAHGFLKADCALLSSESSGLCMVLDIIGAPCMFTE